MLIHLNPPRGGGSTRGNIYDDTRRANRLAAFSIVPTIPAQPVECCALNTAIRLINNTTPGAYCIYDSAIDLAFDLKLCTEPNQQGNCTFGGIRDGSEEVRSEEESGEGGLEEALRFGVEVEVTPSLVLWVSQIVSHAKKGSFCQILLAMRHW